MRELDRKNLSSGGSSGRRYADYHATSRFGACVEDTHTATEAMLSQLPVIPRIAAQTNVCETLNVCSLYHQMQRPEEINHPWRKLALACPRLSRDCLGFFKLWRNQLPLACSMEIASGHTRPICTCLGLEVRVLGHGRLKRYPATKLYRQGHN